MLRLLVCFWSIGYSIRAFHHSTIVYFEGDLFIFYARSSWYLLKHTFDFVCTIEIVIDEDCSYA